MSSAHRLSSMVSIIKSCVEPGPQCLFPIAGGVYCWSLTPLMYGSSAGSCPAAQSAHVLRRPISTLQPCVRRIEKRQMAGRAVGEEAGGRSVSWLSWMYSQYDTHPKHTQSACCPFPHIGKHEQEQEQEHKHANTNKNKTIAAGANERAGFCLLALDDVANHVAHVVLHKRLRLTVNLHPHGKVQHALHLPQNPQHVFDHCHNLHRVSCVKEDPW